MWLIHLLFVLTFLIGMSLGGAFKREPPRFSATFIEWDQHVGTVVTECQGDMGICHFLGRGFHFYHNVMIRKPWHVNAEYRRVPSRKTGRLKLRVFALGHQQRKKKTTA